ncbi:MAG TPA: acylphosphatase [Candidatus Paceibacterota bacterium]|nr:acylphosphatase [Candidatus Paceibacterota bacterium]
MQARIECGFAGKSMGFDYLQWIKDKAEGYGITGLTYLKEDGTIAVVAEGEKRKLEKFSMKLSKGHFWHQIENFYLNWSDASGTFPSFEIATDEVNFM